MLKISFWQDWLVISELGGILNTRKKGNTEKGRRLNAIEKKK
jgi:hypothetical protein